MNSKQAIPNPTLPSYVAVYGSLRKGMGNSRLLGDSVFIGTGWVYGYALQAYCSAFPAAFETTDGQNRVFVEVYKVEPNIAVGLDMLEGYPHFYNREIVEVDGVEVDGVIWMYYIEGECPSSRIIPNGDWVKYKNGEE
jgi:gamma-glutamylcyclotransferase (GGCT)/AIG2-like uncharacterized protein YtfP